MVYDLPTSTSTRGTAIDWKPGWLAWTEYAPGCTPANEYWPTLFVMALRTTAVARSLRSILAAGTTAPLASVTAPMMVPVLAVWAERERAVAMRPSRIRFDFIETPREQMDDKISH